MKAMTPCHYLSRGTEKSRINQHIGYVIPDRDPNWPPPDSASTLEAN
jgi:hypothetical protein